VVKTPVRAPRAKPFAEGWVGTVRRECLDHVLILGRRHLHRVLDAFAEYYNRARPHRSIDLQPPDPAPFAEGVAGSRVRRPDVLGGLIHEYNRRGMPRIRVLEPDTLATTDVAPRLGSEHASVAASEGLVAELVRTAGAVGRRDTAARKGAGRAVSGGTELLLDAPGQLARMEESYACPRRVVVPRAWRRHSQSSEVRPASTPASGGACRS
jgi:hypothetical protein